MSEIRWQEIKEEATEILSRLIKIDTTNPPGNELRVCEFLKEELGKEGIECGIEKTEEGRGNLYAEIKGLEEPPVILLNHTDVVGASDEGWEYPPFSGAVVDGYVWGRGAMDCKGLAVMELMVMKVIKRAGVKLRRTLMFCATADEEMGGWKGARIAAERLSHRLNGAVVLNEGGVGIKKFLAGRDTFIPDFAEKGPIWLKLIARGDAGHASTPHPENPNVKLLRAVNAVLNVSEDYRIIPPLRKAFSLLREEVSLKFRIAISLLKYAPSFILKRLASRNHRVSALLRNTYTLTILKGGYKENVIPSSSEAVIDIRILPGEDAECIISNVKEVCGRYGVDVEVIAREEPSLSEPDTPVMEALREVMKSAYPSSIFFPLMTPGFTDSRFFRKKGAIAYGFMPVLFSQDELDTIHGMNERISIEALLEGTRNLFGIIKKLCV